MMTAEEILVGIDAAPRPARPSVGQLLTPDRPEQRLVPLMGSTSRRH
jgi:hypothetical protein